MRQGFRGSNSSQSRLRQFATRLVGTALITGILTVVPACRVPIRLNNVELLSPSDLGLKKGVTSIEKARNLMRAKGLTGIKSDRYVKAKGKAIEVLAADYQREIHVFMDGIYDHSLPLHCRENPSGSNKTGGVAPYGFALNLAKFGKKTVLLALYSDPFSLTRTHEQKAAPPRIEIFVLTKQGFKRKGTKWLGRIAEKRRGITNPRFVGRDLEPGVTLIAETRTGQAWREVYVVRLNKRFRAEILGMPLEKALKCSCVRDHLGIQGSGSIDSPLSLPGF